MRIAAGIAAGSGLAIEALGRTLADRSPMAATKPGPTPAITCPPKPCFQSSCLVHRPQGLRFRCIASSGAAAKNL